jgi:hypothetical protein
VVHGVILIGLRKFVRERLGDELWHTVQLDAGIGDRVYLPTQSYPGEDLTAIVASVSRLSGMSTALVLESFGDIIAGDLLRMYSSLVDPGWKLFDVLVQSDELLARVARKQGDMLERSPITGRWGREGEVILTYQAALPLCAMIKGIVRGIGAHLEQPLVMDELKCMSTGATTCEFSVRLERSLSERPNSSRRKLTPLPINEAAMKALLGDRGDRPSAPPSIPPSMPPSSQGERLESSGWRAPGTGTTIPPASGVTTGRPSSPSSVPAPHDPPGTNRRR